VGEWFAKGPGSRSIGAVFGTDYADYYYRYDDSREGFDIVVFVESTTPAVKTEGRVGLNRAGGAHAMVPTPPELPDALQNADFTAGDVGAPPKDWSAPLADNTAPGTYRSRVIESADGGRAVELERTESPWRWGAAMMSQVLTAGAFRGKRARFAATVAVDTPGPRGGEVRLFVHAQPAPVGDGGPVAAYFVDPLATEAMHDKPIRSSEPAEYAVTIDVPEEADRIAVGVVLTGTGTVTISNVSLTAE
jgi:hypothetical protein